MRAVESTAAIATIVVGFATLGCNRPDAKSPRTKPANSVVLQHHVERFADQFAGKISQALYPLSTSTDMAIRSEGLYLGLSHYSAIVSIATGRVPELNFIDMMVLVRLSRHAYEDHWLPAVFGEQGRPMLKILKQAEHDIWGLAAREFLSPDDLRDLGNLIRHWQERHPEQYDVASVRLNELAFIAGGASESNRRAPRGLLAKLDKASRTAGDVVQTADRVVFLTQRLPDILRLQLRLGALETVTDASALLAQPAAEKTADTVPQLLAQLTTLMKETRGLVQDVATLKGDGTKPSAFARPLDIEGALDAATELAKSTTVLIRETGGLVERPPDRPSAIAQTGKDLRSEVRGVLIEAGLIGLVLIGAFWAGYFVVRRRG